MRLDALVYRLKWVVGFDFSNIGRGKLKTKKGILLKVISLQKEMYEN